MSQYLSRPPCLSWRVPGGFWRIIEDGEGERLRINNAVRDVDLDDLTDADLEQLQYLISHALEGRRKPQSQPDAP